MQLTSRLQAVPSIAGVLLVLGLILALAVSAVLIGSQRQRLDPFGPAANGRIAFVSEGDIYTANPDGTDPVAVITGADIDGRPVWSHVGSKVAFLRWSSLAASTADLMVLDVDAGTRRPCCRRRGQRSVPSWSPDDRLLTFSYGESQQVYVAPADGSTDARALELVARRRRRASRQMAGGSPTHAPPPVGRRSSSSTSTGRDAHGFRPAHPSFSHGFSHGGMGFAWSPDGSQILFSAGDDATQQFDLYMVATD